MSAGGNHLGLIDMQALCDFIDVSYGGTLAQWKDYLSNNVLLPGPLSDIKLDFDYGRQFSYRSKRIALSYTPELQKIEPDSYLTLGFAYMTDPDKVRWDVGDIEVRASKSNPERINLNRHVVPTDDLDDSHQHRWEKLKNREHPDDGVAYPKNDITGIGTVAGQPSNSPAVLYTAFYAAAGTVPQATMKPKLDLLLKDLQVYEH